MLSAVSQLFKLLRSKAEATVKNVKIIYAVRLYALSVAVTRKIGSDRIIRNSAMPL